MSIIVQRMVDARCAGVIFTADPVTARRTEVVEAVEGIGSALVGGKVTPDHFTLARDGSLVKSELSGPDLRAARRAAHSRIGRAAHRTALRAAGRVRVGDRSHRPHRLAAGAADHHAPGRPTRTRHRGESRRRLHPLQHRRDVPGVATPLTWSTSIHGIDGHAAHVQQDCLPGKVLGGAAPRRPSGSDIPS